MCQLTILLKARKKTELFGQLKGLFKQENVCVILPLFFLCISLYRYYVIQLIGSGYVYEFTDGIIVESS